jgi:hypothetical protein
VIAKPARLLRAAVLSLLVIPVAAVPAWAASHVVLLRSTSDDALSRQGTTLLKAELQTAGFHVVEIERDPTRDLRQDIETTSARLQPVATFAIESIPGGTAVELWLQDRVTGKLVIRRVHVRSGSGAPADLALKAVELLRGSLLEITVQGRADGESASVATGEVARFVADSAPDRLDHFAQGLGIAAGVMAIANASVATAFAPLLRLSWGRPTGTLLRLTATGLGSSPELRAVEGQARVHQSLVLAEGLRVFRARARLQPLAGFSAGAYRVRSEGIGTSSLFPNLAEATTALALGANAGVAARFGKRLALVVDLNLLFLTPSTTIYIASRDVAHAGGLALMMSATLCGVF